MTALRLAAVALPLCLAPLSASGQPEPAGTEAAPRVVVLQLEPPLSDRAWPEAWRRIEAELAAAGLESVTAVAPTADEETLVAGLAQAAGELDAVAAVAVVRAPDGATVLVWLEDGALRRRLPAEALAAPDAVGEVALSITELLHGRFLRIRPAPGAADEQSPTLSDHPGWDDIGPEEEPPPIPVPEEATPEPAEEASPSAPLPPPVPPSMHAPRHSLRRWSLRGGPAAVVPVDPDGLMVSIFLGGGLRLLDWLSLDVEGLVTFVPQYLLTWDHAGSLYAAMLRAFITFEPWPRAVVRPAIGIGGGTLIAWADGEPSPWCDNEGDATAVGLLSLVLRVAVPITASIRVLVAASVGLAIPEIDVSLAGEPVGDLGVPLIDIAIGVEWGLGRWTRFDS